MATRTITGTVYTPDGTAWAAGIVTFALLEAFETSTQVYPTKTHSETLDAQGQFTTALGVPDTGTAHYRVSLPDGESHEFYLAAGASVDLVTLIVATNPAVDPDAVQTLLDAAAVFTISNPTGTYQMLVTDEYIRASGTFAVTLVPAILTQPGVLIRNIGAGIITATAAGTDTINGAATLTLYPNDRYAFIVGATGVWEA